MTDGIYIDNGNGSRRPKSKKELKEAIATNPSGVVIENTSMHGGKGGRLTDPHTFGDGDKVTFVGPNPYTDRKFYGTITVSYKNGSFSAKVA